MTAGEPTGAAATRSPGILGRGRTLAEPGFPDDDGSADPAIREALLGGISVALARRLRGVRLLVSVVAVADEVDESGTDTSSHMAVVSMLNERGERGLLAFTGSDSLAAWNAQARPVPALGRDVGRAALDDGALAVVFDVAGPLRVVVAGVELVVLADALDLDAVAPLVREALAGVRGRWSAVRLVDARGTGVEADILVELTVLAGSPADGHRTAIEQIAAALAGCRELQRLVPGGIAVTVAPGEGGMPS